jgi:hypothetical protein
VFESPRARYVLSVHGFPEPPGSRPFMGGEAVERNRHGAGTTASGGAPSGQPSLSLTPI